MSIPNGRGGVRTINALFFLFLSLFMTFFSVYFIVLRKYHISIVMLDRQRAEMKFLRDEKEQLYVVTAKQRGELETLYEHSIELARRLDRLEGFKVEIESIIHKLPSSPKPGGKPSTGRRSDTSGCQRRPPLWYKLASFRDPRHGRGSHGSNSNKRGRHGQVEISGSGV